MTAEHESDEELYRKYLAGDGEDSFRVLFLRHKDSLILFLNGYVHNFDDAEELMIDAFAEAAAGSAAFSGKSSFKTWLFSIGKKMALSRMRKAPSLPLDREDLPSEPSDSPEAELLRDERSVQLYKALERLNADYRQILILLYFEQMSVEEAARVMGRNKKQIYHLTERARSALREQLEKAGFDPAPFR